MLIFRLMTYQPPTAFLFQPNLKKTMTEPPLQSLLGLLAEMFATKFMQTGNLPVN